MRAVFVALIVKFQSVISAERTGTSRPKMYLRSIKRAGVDKIRRADLLKLHLGVKVDPQEKKIFQSLHKVREMLNASTLIQSIRTLALNFKTPRSVECHFLLLELSTLHYALMNSIVPLTNQVLLLLEQLRPWTRDRVKLLQSPYFSASSPPRYKHHHPYPKIFCSLPRFARTKRRRWQPVELNDRQLRSHGKIVDCEQSSLVQFEKTERETIQTENLTDKFQNWSHGCF